MLTKNHRVLGVLSVASLCLSLGAFGCSGGSGHGGGATSDRDSGPKSAQQDSGSAALQTGSGIDAGAGGTGTSGSDATAGSEPSSAGDSSANNPGNPGDDAASPDLDSGVSTGPGNPVAADGAPPTATGTTYYLAANGSDHNDGLSPSSPWLTPKHDVNCGDMIVAAASTAYQASNFVSWGTVSCPSGDNVAWLACEAFDACKITTSNYAAIDVNASYWGVQGWEVSNSGGSCFYASPATKSATVHHIIFANDVANGCANGGFGSDPYEGATGPASVDYLVIVGNLSYKAVSGASECYSGISIYEPQNFDTAPGTHIYIAQNISWSNVDSPSCPGNTDGEGIILDTWSGNQSNLPAFTGQGVVENNLLLGNGGPGFEVFFNTKSTIVVRNNSTYGNGIDPTHDGTYQGEFLLNSSSDTTAEYNIFDAIAKTEGKDSYPYYALYVGAADSTDAFDYDWASGTGGNNQTLNNSKGVSFGSHDVVGTSPGFASPAVPPAPSCSGTASTHACMAAAFAGFAPSASGTSGVGYQPVTSTYAANPDFPSWLCGANLPAGVVSNYCP